jgi:serine/threonine-protein kinase
MGRGGMAIVYRVDDTATGRSLALKQLAILPSSRHQAEVSALFEREYHTLAELAHPSIIEVYDYGIAEDGPFYTMQLLEGGDLRDRAPVPWREACVLLHDVCSSLALLHSRRLVHRDVSPRNVRCTAEGRAKLIDFGAMVPMGRGAAIVGTPAYLAPEVLNRSSVDARTDLFSLGATLYYALTGHQAYPARDFSRLPDLWKVKPARPSSFGHDIPSALDALVLSLINVESASRPRSASEVMQRLAVLAGLDEVEPVGVSQAYLSTPMMVGRDDAMALAKKEMDVAFGGRSRCFVVDGDSGVGRSRFLDACALAAKTTGAVVLRLEAASARTTGFAAAESVVDQLAEAFPIEANDEVSGARLDQLIDPALSRFEVQTGITRYLLALGETMPIAIAVDDFQALDEPSAALLASLASQATRQRLLIMATVDASAPVLAPAPLDVLRERAARIALGALERADADALFVSLFGDVPNVGLVANGIYAVAKGNPRECMDLAQYLVDRGAIRYERGTWTLPQYLGAADLPTSAEGALRERLKGISLEARRLAETHALATDKTLTRAQYGLFTDADPGAVDRAITELLSQQVIVSDGNVYSIAHGGWVGALTEALSPDERAARHRVIAASYPGDRDFASVRHLLEGGLEIEGLERLVAIFSERIGMDFALGQTTDPSALAPVFARALDVSLRHGRSLREQHEVRRWLTSLSIFADDDYFFRAAPDWLARIEVDSGFSDWKSLEHVEEPVERLSAAMQIAFARYAATPEHERVYRPDEAIRWLALYVAVAIAIGARTQNARLLLTLHDYLVPFENITPVIRAVSENAIATCDVVVHGRLEQARDRWKDIYERMGALGESAIEGVDTVRRAVAYGLGSIESRLGLVSTNAWADVLDRDPLQKVNALYLRKILSLHQGDWDGAERFRRQAESLALETPRQMFTTSPIFELQAHCHAEDLIGLKQVLDRLEPLAARYEGYRAYREMGEGFYQKIRGDLPLAIEAFSRAIALSAPDPAFPWRTVPAWPRSVAGLVETLIALDRSEEAREAATLALGECRKRGIGVLSHDISRALALAEAKLGEYDAAANRLQTVIEEQLRLGVSGLSLGASYEARARIAILAVDETAVDEYARLTANEYRKGRGSPLGARYERLMDDVASAVSGELPDLADYGSTGFDSTRVDGRASAMLAVADSLRGVDDRAIRASRLLGLLCDGRGATAGYLYVAKAKGLELVASRADLDPPDGLAQFVTASVDAAVRDSTPWRFGARAEQSWTEIQGIGFCPLMLVDNTTATPLIAGIAVLVDRHHRARPFGESLLTSAIGAALLKSGDASGLRFA